MTDKQKTGYATDSGNIVSPVARASFVNVFRPAKPMAGSNGEPKYTITLLFPKDADLALLRKAAGDAAKEKWGDKIPKGLRSPFRDQGEKDYDGYEAGCTFVTATSKQRPGIVDGVGADIVEERDLYSGSYVWASLRAFAYDNAGNRGVAFGLQNVQKIKDGDPLGGRSRPSDDFKPVAGAASAKGAAGMFDEEIPF